MDLAHREDASCIFSGVGFDDPILSLLTPIFPWAYETLLYIQPPTVLFVIKSPKDNLPFIGRLPTSR